MSRIGIAVGEKLIVGWASGSSVRRSDGPTGQCRFELPFLRDDPAVWVEVAAVFARITAALSLSAGPSVRGSARPSVRRSHGPTVSITLLPPLVQVRRIELPRLRPEERLRVLGRDAARYFAGVTAPQVVGVHPVDPGRGSPEALLVAAAPAWLLDGLSRAADECGWTIRQVIPAHVAWMAAGEGATLMAVAGDEVVELMAWASTGLTGVRRTMAAPERVVAAVAELQVSGPVSLVGTSTSSGAIASALSAAGYTLVQPPEADPAILAARHAGTRSTLELVPDRIRARRREWSRTITRRLLAASVALVLGAIGLVRWDLATELAAVSRARSAVRGQVDAALATRDSIETMRGQLAALTEAEATAPRWTALLGTLAARLPDNGSLTSLEAVGDSVALEGEADEAGTVFGALREASIVVGLQASAPIRQEASGDEPPIERFALTLRLRPFAGSTLGGPR